MAVFGQGINPALGRIDYTPYAQGAVAGAQGIAQGLAALGQGAAQGVQNYLKRKEEKQQEEAAVSTIGGILKRNPELASQLNLQPDAAGNFDQGALKAAIKGAGGPANTLKLASTLEELGVARQARQQQADAARFAGMFDNQGQMLSPLRSDALAQFSPEARAMGQQMVTQRAQALANLGKTNAEIIALGRPKTPARPSGEEALVQSRIAEWQALNPGKAIPPSEEAKIREEARPKPATTTIKMPDTETATQVFNMMNTEREKAAAAVRALPAYAETARILRENKGKDVYTGIGSEAKLFLAKALAPLGFDQTSANNTEVLRAQLAVPVFALVKQLGSGSGITDTDRKYSAMAAGGEITLNAESIQRLSEIGERATNALIDDYNQRLDDVYPEADSESFRTRRALLLRRPTKAQTQAAFTAPQQPASGVPASLRPGPTTAPTDALTRANSFLKRYGVNQISVP